jgi:hypothetical protein
MKPVIYTAVCGQEYKSKLNEEINPFSNLQKVNRTNIPITVFTGENIFQNPIMEAKRYKVLGHQFFPDNDILIWIDANISINIPVAELIEKYLGNNDLAIFKHPYRESVYDEFATLKTDPRFANAWLQKNLHEQEAYYRSIEGMFTNRGLWECNFIIRRNKHNVNILFEQWWAEICRWQWRDQVSFPIAWEKWQLLVKLNSIPGNIRENPDFTYTNHY